MIFGFLFFLLNSTVLFFVLAGLGNFVELLIARFYQVEETGLYGQKLLTLAYSEVSESFAVIPLFGFLIALIIGIYSSVNKTNLDRKFFLSKKGFLANAIFMLFFVVAGNLVGVYDKTDDIETVYDSYKTEDNVLLLMQVGETPQSFEKRLLDSKNYDLKTNLAMTFDDNCGFLAKPLKVTYDYLSAGYVTEYYPHFIQVKKSEINETIVLFNSSYKPNYRRCEYIEQKSREDAERRKREKERERQESQAKSNKQKNKQLRDDADSLCNTVNGTTRGC
jgi:hypothetical protein